MRQTLNTSVLLINEDLTVPLIHLVMKTVRLISGTATESKLLPVTVTTVPPLKIHTKYILRKYLISLTSKLKFRNDFALLNPGIVVYSYRKITTI